MSRTTVIGIWSLWALGLFSDLGVPLILGGYYPGYSQILHTVSELGSDASPVQIWESLALAAEGVVLIALALSLAFLGWTSHWAWRCFLASIIIFGVGSVIAGIFPEDSAGAAETVNGKVHGIASGIGFLFYIAMPAFALAFLRDRYSRLILAVLLVIGLATFWLFISAMGSQTPPWSFTGLWQRLCLANGYLVIGFVMWRLVIGRVPIVR